MKLFLILVTLVAIASSSRGAFFTNSASADSFVRSNAPNLNYGGAGALSVSGPGSANGSGVTNGAFDSFIRFNTSAMVTNFNSTLGTNNWVINGAKLRVTEMGAPANTLFNRGKGAFEIRWIANDNWIEGTNQPTMPTTNGIAYNDEVTLLNGGMDVSLGTFTNAGADVTLSFPLALPIAFTGDLTAGGNVGIFLTAIDPAIGFTMDSRSFGTTNARPFLEISAVPRPGIIGIDVSGTNIILTAVNGAAGETYFALASMNAALPLNQWLPIATNLLSVNGNFSVVATNAIAVPAPPQQFFILQLQ